MVVLHGTSERKENKLANWTPLLNKNDAGGRGCQKCGSKEGRSIDDKGRIYCPAHRSEHNK